MSVEFTSRVAPGPPALTLDRSAIHVWLAFPESLAVTSLQRCREILSPEERQQEQRFYFLRDQRRYVITRALVRQVLSRYATIPPEAWLFGASSHGRPEILNWEDRARDLVFNISHTRGLIVVAVTSRPALGVDVENTVERAAPLGVAGRFFAPREAAALRELPLEDQAQRFWEYWTFKESYIKARGLGLSLPLERFSFRFPDERSVNIEIDVALGDDPRRWTFWQFRPTPRHLVALCATNLPACQPAPLVREVVPFTSEHILPTVFTRRTQPCLPELGR